MFKSENYLKCLEEAGWYPGRKIEISYMIEELESYGYEKPNRLVCSLLEEYWNLSFETRVNYIPVIHIRLNVCHTLSFLDINEFEELELEIGERLIPVGTGGDDYLLFLVTNSGKLYTLKNEYPYEILEFSNDFYEFMDGFFTTVSN